MGVQEAAGSIPVTRTKEKSRNRKGYGTFLFFIHSASHAKKRNKSGIKAE